MMNQGATEINENRSVQESGMKTSVYLFDPNLDPKGGRHEGL